MNKRTDKIVDALGSLDEEQIAACLRPRRRKALFHSGKARIALVLAASLLITVLASALIVAPMMLGDSGPGEQPIILPEVLTDQESVSLDSSSETESTAPGTVTDAETSAPGTFEDTGMAPDTSKETVVPPVGDTVTYPGTAQLVRFGSISHSGYTVSNAGIINLPGKDENTSFAETEDYFSAPIPIITLSCGSENTVRLHCDYGVIGKVAREKEYGEYVYKYVDDNGGRWDINHCWHFGDGELTLNGDESFSWFYAAHSGYSDTGCNRDTFIDYTVENPEGEIIAAGSIYVASFRYLFSHDLNLMTDKSFDRALSNFEMFEREAAQYTIRKPINLYSETFMDENGEIDLEKRDAFFAYHDTIKSIRSTVSESEWIDTSRYANDEAGYDISDLARENEQNWVNPYAYDEPEMGMPTEDVLASFDETQVAFYDDFLVRKQAARTSLEESFTSHDLLLVGFAKLCNDHLGFHPWSKEYSGGVSCGTMAVRSEYMVFEVRGYNEEHDTADWWLVINDRYYRVKESSNQMHEGEDYHFVEHYILEKGIEVYFYFSDTLEDKIEVIYP